MDPIAGKFFLGFRSDHPEISERLMIPQLFPVRNFIQNTDVIFHMFCDNIHSNLSQIKVGSHSGGSGNTGFLHDSTHQSHRHLFWSYLIKAEIFRHIDKTFIYAVNMNIFPGYIAEINTVSPCRIFQVKLHSRHRCNILNVFRDFMDPASVFYAQPLHCRCDCQANGRF